MTNPFVHASLLGYAFISLCNGSELLQKIWGSPQKLDLGFNTCMYIYIQSFNPLPSELFI